LLLDSDHRQHDVRLSQALVAERPIALPPATKGARVYVFIPTNSIARALVDGLIAVVAGVCVYVASRYLGLTSPIPGIAALIAGVGLYCTLWAVYQN